MNTLELNAVRSEVEQLRQRLITLLNKINFLQLGCCSILCEKHGYHLGNDFYPDYIKDGQIVQTFPELINISFNDFTLPELLVLCEVPAVENQLKILKEF